MFAAQYEGLCRDDDAMEVAGEVTALITALEEHGHDIEGEQPGDASHPVVTSRYATFAMRRTPPTEYTPYADRAPVIRIPYVWFHDTEREREVAVVMLMGDKTSRGNTWYPDKVARIEHRMNSRVGAAPSVT